MPLALVAKVSGNSMTTGSFQLAVIWDIPVLLWHANPGNALPETRHVNRVNYSQYNQCYSSNADKRIPRKKRHYMCRYWAILRSWWLPEHYVGVVTQWQCLGWHINDGLIAFETDIFTYRLSPAAPSCSTSPKPTVLKFKTTGPPIWPREVQWPPPWGIWALLCSLLMSASRRLSEEGYKGCKSRQFLIMKHQSK